MELKIIPLSTKNFSDYVREIGSELPSKETFKAHDKKSTKETILHRVGVITPVGRMVGFGMGVTGPWDPILTPGHFEITVQVDKSRNWKYNISGYRTICE